MSQWKQVIFANETGLISQAWQTLTGVTNQNGLFRLEIRQI